MYLQNSFNAQRHQKQAGFSLVEVSIVMAIVLLLSIIAIPTVRTYVIESKVPNASGGSTTPYDSIGTGNLAGMLRDSGVIAVSGSAATPTVRHGLGGDGQVSVAQAEAGAAFSITLSKVNHAACPSIASVLQRLSDRIVLTPEGGSATIIKDDDTLYSALQTEAHCSQGDGNTFVFTVS